MSVYIKDSNISKAANRILINDDTFLNQLTHILNIMVFGNQWDRNQK
jgi:hypothetical protein